MHIALQDWGRCCIIYGRRRNCISGSSPNFFGVQKQCYLFIVPGNHGRTTSLEFLSQEDIKFNLMVSDVGDNADFGPEKVNSEEHLKRLGNADATIVANWGSNLKGTQLAEYVFENSPKGSSFYRSSRCRDLEGKIFKNA